MTGYASWRDFCQARSLASKHRTGNIKCTSARTANTSQQALAQSIKALKTTGSNQTIDALADQFRNAGKLVFAPDLRQQYVVQQFTAAGLRVKYHGTGRYEVL